MINRLRSQVERDDLERSRKGKTLGDDDMRNGSGFFYFSKESWVGGSML